MELQRTTEANGHYHVVYTRGVDVPAPIGYTSKDDDHIHMMAWKETVPPVLDELQNEVTPAVPGKYYLMESKGHTHEIVTLDRREIGNDNSEKGLKRMQALFKEAKELEQKSFESGKEAEDFYMGEQWDAGTKAALDEQGRACLTINKIEPKIDILSGIQRNNRSDIKYYPKKDGSEITAEIMTIVAKHICDDNNFDMTESAVFEDASIAGRGNLHIYADYTKDLTGDIIIDRDDWDGVLYGPHKRVDAYDCEYSCRFKKYSIGKLKQMYPDKAEEIERDIKSAEMMESPAEETHQTNPGEAYQGDSGFTISTTATTDKDLVDIAKKEYTVVELHERMMTRTPVIVNVLDDFYFNAEMMDPTDVEKAKTLAKMKVVLKPTQMIKTTTFAGGVKLWQDENDYDILQTIPVYAKKRRDIWWGKVKPLIDPQMEVNKRTSQSVDIVNKVASYGWYYDGDTFANDAEAAKFEKSASMPGFIVKVADTGRIPVQTEGVKMPGEVYALEQKASDQMKEISNINNELLGISMRQQSVNTTTEFKKQGLVGNEFLFDNLSLAKRQLGRLILKMVQNVFSNTKIKSILHYMQSRAQEMGDQYNIFQKYTDEDIDQALKNKDLSKYDVAVGESATSPTRRTANFNAFMEMAGRGIPIPPEIMFKLSDLPPKEKQEAQDIYAKQQQMAAQTEAAKANSEVQKAQIAASAKIATSGQGQQQQIPQQ